MSYSVLIIDDEPMICMGIHGMIDWRKYGFEKTDIRFDFEDGLEAAMAYPYSLVITDIRLHNASGLDIVRKVKAVNPNCMFVLISAHAEFEYAQTALELSVCQYLLKPIRKETLEACVERVGGLLAEKSPAEEPEATQPEGKISMPRHGVKNPRLANVNLILDYIHANYWDQSLSLSKVAGAFFMNASYLGQCFRQQTGVKFTDYLNQFRIAKACELLMQDQFLTYEIREKVGFKNQNYFHTVFRKVMGLGTEEFRKKVRTGDVNLPVLLTQQEESEKP